MGSDLFDIKMHSFEELDRKLNIIIRNVIRTQKELNSYNKQSIHHNCETHEWYFNSFLVALKQTISHSVDVIQQKELHPSKFQSIIDFIDKYFSQYKAASKPNNELKDSFAVYLCKDYKISNEHNSIKKDVLIRYLNFYKQVSRNIDEFWQEVMPTLQDKYATYRVCYHIRNEIMDKDKNPLGLQRQKQSDKEDLQTRQIPNNLYEPLTTFIQGGTDGIAYIMEHKQPRDGVKLKWISDKGDALLLQKVLSWSIPDINRCIQFKGGKRLTKSNEKTKGESEYLRQILQRLK